MGKPAIPPPSMPLDKIPDLENHPLDCSCSDCKRLTEAHSLTR